MKTPGMTTVLTWIAAGGLAPAGPVSNTVGFVRVDMAAPTTVAVADPFVAPDSTTAVTSTAATLAAQAVAGDRLHVWTGSSFNTYAWSGAVWEILGTAVAAPDSRLDGTARAGCLVTRSASGASTLVLRGSVSAAGTTTVTVAAQSWALLGCPYPVDLCLADLVAAGVGAGDAIRVWQVASQSWQVYRREAAAWSTGEGSDVVVPAGTAFLYYNARSTEAVLTFQAP